jgi:hypothetical protein
MSGNRVSGGALSPLAEAPFEDVEVIGFKNSQTSVEQFSLRDDDDVEPCGNLVSTEDLSYQSFSAISLDGATQFFRRRDSKPAKCERIGSDEDRAVTAVDARTLRVNQLILGAFADPFLRPENGRGHGLFAADRKAFTPLGAAALQHQAAILGAHPYEKPMGFLTVASIRLERALALHEVPSVKRTFNVSEGVPKVSTLMGCATVCVLLENDSNHLSSSCVFGLLPKFSTPVEKTVEKPNFRP